MRIAIVAPSGVPFLVGGAEKLWWGLLHALNQHTPHHAELIKLPSPEQGFWELMTSYRSFSRLDLAHFDLVISTKYPAWMVAHPNHYCYLQHKLRGLYDTYQLTGLPTVLGEIPAPLRPLVHAMDTSRRDRTELEPFFELLFGLRDDPSLPPDSFAFPGPLTRRIVHFLDDIALAPTAIRRYLAISRNVAGREDYFPPGAQVTVVHHPSDLPHFETGGYDYLFTASRLDHPKRLDLLVRAFRQVRGEIEFRIAGTGPQAQALQVLAAKDPRIRFLGHVSDQELTRLYANALFVPFVPYDEDYGLVTIEAMQSGKAVLTTLDAGGVNEFVEHGVTGLCVTPEVPALAEAMQRLLADRSETMRMGGRAQQRVSGLDWPSTVAQILGEPQGHGAVSTGRRRLVVAVDFPVYPPRGGGQSRIFHLYRALARRVEVTLITLCDDASIAGALDLAPGLREIRVAKSPAHLEMSQALNRKLAASVGDIASLLHYGLTPAYLERLGHATVCCDLVIASHPYLYPAIAEVYVGPLWYEAHNVEYDMKRAILAASAEAAFYLERVREAEASLCARAERIMVCSQPDAHRLQALYGCVRSQAILVPNGVDARAVRFVTRAERRSNQCDLGLDRRLSVLFVGSGHRPNIEALGYLKRIAHDCPEADFLTVGSVSGYTAIESQANNLYPLGILDDAELTVVTEAVDLAVNPITTGSGTNLKMLQYAAAGIPILTTEFGNRGLELRPGEHLWQAPISDFPAAIRRLREGLKGERKDEQIEATVRRARELVESRYDWQMIADGIDISARGNAREIAFLED
ncbi:glycosyltransferase family 4 protein [Candidatus Thiosymbion oneisti]|uniref:glycosyltransferase family 4 protein n=1 Tax=Candidatus Thiosymbion oneisti TaxID=589554 RepID=UPI000A7E18B9|nr:glycosyltransferase family 4 protein [Candidatus Thiosymbion oneisti]